MVFYSPKKHGGERNMLEKSYELELNLSARKHYKIYSLPITRYWGRQEKKFSLAENFLL